LALTQQRLEPEVCTLDRRRCRTTVTPRERLIRKNEARTHAALGNRQDLTGSERVLQLTYILTEQHDFTSLQEERPRRRMANR
jgi:hypothetical protein